MRILLAAILATTSLSFAFADDHKPLTIAGLKAPPPKEWTVKPPPQFAMGREATFGLPPADGEKDEAEIVVFFFKDGGGSIEQNLDRQRGSFLPAEGKDKVDEKLTDSKVGTLKAKYLDLNGTYKKKPNPMAERFTPMKDYRELYVAFDSEDGGRYYIRVLGPAKTVEKHKKSFDEWLAAFK